MLWWLLYVAMVLFCSSLSGLAEERQHQRSRSTMHEYARRAAHVSGEDATDELASLITIESGGFAPLQSSAG